MDNPNNELIIDVDKVIEIFNKKNPKLKQLDRKEVAKKLGVKTQLFSDWKRKKTPRLAWFLLELEKIGGCDLEDFVIPKTDA